ncbi:hypothetical protein [Flexivirga oryzae]|uniref:Exo-alpha-sialidase n=1 Tax=Flexivirga oryzae TaxID=1794944 RepID=A0A839N613_9MICO|nr:hypothetical protein [Flexivirga oryzae]MBB2890191.1 hypothetical protein [Flexivirga oryzae]
MKASLTGAVIGGLVLVNAVALVAVEQHFKVTAEASPAASGSTNPLLSGTTAPSAESSSPSVAAASSPSSSAAAGGKVMSPGVFTVAADGSRAWRAVNSGGCDGGSVQVQATQDGGVTWTTLGTVSAGAADGLGFDASGLIQLRGEASSGCTQGAWSLSTDGSWATSTPTSWAPKGAKSADVTYQGKQHQACASGTVIDLATADANVDVLCSTGDVRTVTPAGKASTVYTAAGLISIGTTQDNTLVVARTVSGCDGVELDKIVNSKADSMTCVKDASKAVDLTFAGDHGWLVAANNTWTGTTSGDWSKR